jgi:hypothetical protein
MHPASDISCRYTVEWTATSSAGTSPPTPPP